MDEHIFAIFAIINLIIRCQFVLVVFEASVYLLCF